MKQQMQDMIPNEKRTIRRIPVDKTKRGRPLPPMQPRQDVDVAVPPTPPTEPPRATTTPQMPQYNNTGGGRKKRSLWKWAIGVVVALILIFFIFSLVFSGATVTAEPRNESVTVDGQFSAVVASKATIDVLPFEVMTVTKTRSKEVKATGEKEVNTKASGRIVVFNDFDEEPQRLINNTRFETSEGLIYRIGESIVVPGQTTNAGGETVPGSIEVEVFADEAGAEYNIGLTDFTIPGFEGDPRFFKFFARSKTEMTGGFSGMQKTVVEADENTARTALQAELLDVLMSEATAEVPEGFAFYEGATFVTFENAPQVTTESKDTVGIQEKGTLQAIIFDETELSSFIAEQTVGTYDGAPVMFNTLADLAIAIVDKDLVDTTTLEALDMTVAGTGTIVWTFDEIRLKEDLAGKPRTDTDMVLSGYPAIERAEIVLRPFWKRVFPDNHEDIEVEIKLDSA